MSSSGHRLGVILSLVGAALGVIAVVCVFVSVLPGLGGFLEVPGILGLFAICGLIPGEQLRRGRMERNPDAPKTRLPKASNVSRFRMLGTGWHVLWIVLGLAISGALVGIPVHRWFTSGYSDDDVAAGFWVIYGSLAFGITVAAIVSLGKKLTWLRRRSNDARPSPAWRWVTYRMRLDIWAAGVGGVLIAVSPTFVAADLGPYEDSYGLAADLPATITVASIGVLLVVLGAVLSGNFWRAGVDLGGGESYS